MHTHLLLYFQELALPPRKSKWPGIQHEDKELEAGAHGSKFWPFQPDNDDAENDAAIFRWEANKKQEPTNPQSSTGYEHQSLHDPDPVEEFSNYDFLGNLEGLAQAIRERPSDVSSDGSDEERDSHDGSGIAGGYDDAARLYLRHENSENPLSLQEAASKYGLRHRQGVEYHVGRMRLTAEASNLYMMGPDRGDDNEPEVLPHTKTPVDKRQPEGFLEAVLYGPSLH